MIEPHRAIDNPTSLETEQAAVIKQFLAMFRMTDAKLYAFAKDVCDNSTFVLGRYNELAIHYYQAGEHCDECNDDGWIEEDVETFGGGYEARKLHCSCMDDTYSRYSRYNHLRHGNMYIDDEVMKKLNAHVNGGMFKKC